MYQHVAAGAFDPLMMPTDSAIELCHRAFRGRLHGMPDYTACDFQYSGMTGPIVDRDPKTGLPRNGYATLRFGDSLQNAMCAVTSLAYGGSLDIRDPQHESFHGVIGCPQSLYGHSEADDPTDASKPRSQVEHHVFFDPSTAMRWVQRIFYFSIQQGLRGSQVDLLLAAMFQTLKHDMLRTQSLATLTELVHARLELSGATNDFFKVPELPTGPSAVPGRLSPYLGGQSSPRGSPRGSPSGSPTVSPSYSRPKAPRRTMAPPLVDPSTGQYYDHVARPQAQHQGGPSHQPSPPAPPFVLYGRGRGGYPRASGRG